MMPTSPSPSLKFGTADFPQYGFKASLSAETCPATSQVKPAPGMPCSTTGLSSAFAPGRVGMPCRALSPNASELPDAAVREAHASLPQGGLLGSGASCAVSRHPRLLRPHPPVPQARDDFTSWTLIRRAFAVRERLGDPQDLPYFRGCAFLTCRPPYAGGSAASPRYSLTPRCQASSR